MRARDQIEKLITDNAIVLFMKGVPQAPQCGFSAAVVKVLDAVGTAYASVNVLADPLIREAIKEYSDWPTIPQLYVRGEFVGGCDIVREMYASGELSEMIAPESAQ